MKKFYDLFIQVIESRRFSRVVRKLSYYRNPIEKELFEEIRTKKTKQTNQELNSKDMQLKKLQNSYEYKVFEHSKKVEYWDKNRRGADLIKFLDTSLYESNNKKMWTKSSLFIRSYNLDKDYVKPWFWKFSLFLACIVAFKFGFHNGFKDSNL